MGKKDNKVYTVNKWNKPLFMSDKRENLFADAGLMRNIDTSNLGTANFAPYVNSSNSLTGKALQGLQNQNNQIAIQNAFNLGQQQGGSGGFNFGSLFGGGSGSGGSGGGSVGITLAQSVPGIMRGFKAGFQDRPQYTEDAHNGFSTVDTLLTNGKKSKLGTSLVNSGASWMNNALSSGDFKGALYAGIVGTAGTIINNGWGMSVDEDAERAGLESIERNRNFISNANNLDDIVLPEASAAAKDIYEGGVFKKGAAKTKNEEFKYNIKQAKDFAWNGISNNINNISDDQLNRRLASYAAFGGPIETMNDNNMGAIGYNFMDRYLTQKEKSNQSKNQMTNMFAGMPSSLFAIGGDLQTHGSDWSDGMITVGAGGSHEESPYDGVQMGTDPEGTPNLVEEGEVVWNDYVFSARIPVDMTTKEKFHLPKKKEITYADLAKKLEKEISERTNDPISKAGFKAQMETLEEQQERQKAEMEAARAREAFEALSPEEQTAVMQRMAQEEAIAQQAAAQQTQAQQPTPEEIAMAEQQQMMQADGSQAIVGQEPQQFAEGGDKGKKNAGTWKSGSIGANWNAYTRNGLRDYLLKVNDDLAAAETEAEKKKIREEAIKTVNNIQKAYSEAYQPNLTPSEKNEKVEALQKAFKEAGGNAYFSGIEKNINLPKGHNTEDIEDKWVDGYWGPRTSIRNWGSTEYNDVDYNELSDLAKEAGLTYAPGEYKYGDHTLYQLGMAPESVAKKEDEPELVVDYGDNTPQEKVVTTPSPQSPAQANPNEKNENLVPVHKKEWPRYVGLFGPAVGLGMQALGIGKPDASGIDAAIATANQAPALAEYQPIGNYLRYNPMDIWYEQNALNAQSRATDRALLNTISPSKAAGLLANGYNSQLASGNLYRKALEYNDALKKQVEEFNRGTDMFNAQAYNQNQQFNADAKNRARQAAAQIGLHGAQAKMDADAGWYNGIYGNVAGLFKGISDLGTENMRENTRNWMWSKGIGGVVDPDDPYFGVKREKKAKGGDIKRKKGKRGLTF